MYIFVKKIELFHVIFHFFLIVYISVAMATGKKKK